MGVDLGLGPVLKIVFTYLERAGMTSEVSTGQEGPGSGRDSKFFAGGNAPNQTEGKNSLGCLPPYEDVSIRHCLKSRVSCLFPRGRVVSPFELAQLELFSPFNLSTFQPFNHNFHPNPSHHTSNDQNQTSRPIAPCRSSTRRHSNFDSSRTREAYATPSSRTRGEMRISPSRS